MSESIQNSTLFSGNIFIFSAFDVGDDINLDKVASLPTIKTAPIALPKNFKNYHTPLAIDVPYTDAIHKKAASCKIHNFGAISFIYKVPFVSTLNDLSNTLQKVVNEHLEQSSTDVKNLFNLIDRYITKPKFFDTRSSYTVIQVDPLPEHISVAQLQETYGSTIASMLRFETEILSEEQKNDILDSAIGYFRGDLIIVDTDATFAYESDFPEVEDFFEFANIQQLELRFFDRFLDAQLNKIYEGSTQKLPLKSYLPFIGIAHDPVADLGKIKVDISVICERLEGSLKVGGDPYFSELYGLLVQKLDLKNWQHGIDRKLSIIHDIRIVYQHKTDAVREDLLSVLVILLIFIELIIGILNYIKVDGH